MKSKSEKRRGSYDIYDEESRLVLLLGSNDPVKCRIAVFDHLDNIRPLHDGDYGFLMNYIRQFEIQEPNMLCYMLDLQYFQVYLLIRIGRMTL